jgi:hypothetical protein
VNDLPAGPARYGTTPVDPDDLGALVEGLVVTTKAGLDELEAAGLARVWQNRAERMISGQIDLEELTEPEALGGASLGRARGDLDLGRPHPVPGDEHRYRRLRESALLDNTHDP